MIGNGREGRGRRRMRQGNENMQGRVGGREKGNRKKRRVKRGIKAA